MIEDRRQQLDSVMARLEVRYGPRALQRAGTIAPSTPGCVATGFPELDAALGQGGLPRGRISELSGAATSGKVTLVARTVAAAQQEPEALAGWVDLSHTIDPWYLAGCGVDLERLLVVRPADSAGALAITRHLLESNTLAVLVFDGLADVEPACAQMMMATLERLAVAVTATETAVLMLSEPQAESRTLAHVAAVRLRLARGAWLSEGADVLGYESQVAVAKNRPGPAGASVTLRIVFDDADPQKQADLT